MTNHCSYMTKSAYLLHIGKHRFLWLLAVSVIAFIFINTLFNIRFETVDDLAMALIASGAYSGSPDNHLIFINMLYGSFLNALYFMQPHHEWYTISFIAINILSTALIAWKIVGTKHTKLAKSVFLLFTYCAFFNLTIQLQFTRTAAIAAVAGVILLSDADQRRKYLGSFMFIVASLIRFEAAFLVLLITGPIFLQDYLQTGKVRINNSISMLIATVAVSIGCKAIDHSYYQQNQDWSYFKKYNAARGKIHGLSNARLLIRDLPEGISKADYMLLLDHHPDPNIVDHAALLRVITKMSEMSAATKQRPLNQLRKHQASLLLFLLITLACAYPRPWKNPTSMVIIMMMIMTIAALVYISIRDSPKDRVFFAVLVAFIIPMPFLLNGSFYRVQKYTVLLSFFFLSYILHKQSSSVIKNHPDNAQIYENNARLVSAYLSDPKKKIRFYYDYKSEHKDPFAISSNFPTGRIAGSGWATHIPFSNSRFKSFEDYIGKYGVLVSRERFESATSLITESILLNYQKKVEPRIAAECDDSVIVEFDLVDDAKSQPSHLIKLRPHPTSAAHLHVLR